MSTSKIFNPFKGLLIPEHLVPKIQSIFWQKTKMTHRRENKKHGGWMGKQGTRVEKEEQETRCMDDRTHTQCSQDSTFVYIMVSWRLYCLVRVLVWLYSIDTIHCYVGLGGRSITSSGRTYWTTYSKQTPPSSHTGYDTRSNISHILAWPYQDIIKHQQGYRQIDSTVIIQHNSDKLNHSNANKHNLPQTINMSMPLITWRFIYSYHSIFATGSMYVNII